MKSEMTNIHGERGSVVCHSCCCCSFEIHQKILSPVSRLAGNSVTLPCDVPELPAGLGYDFVTVMVLGCPDYLH